jgi:glucan endo-1,3-alpha-glucosidase
LSFPLHLLIFYHFVNSYSYAQADWENDIQQIQAMGVCVCKSSTTVRNSFIGSLSDAIALNTGGQDWDWAQIASAYAAAEALGTNFKLFISFDFTATGMVCDVPTLIGWVNQYANHPNQFLYNGQTFISSFQGDCLGNDGWQTLKSSTNGYLMPFISGLEGTFDSWPALDSWFWCVVLSAVCFFP